jgi:hypothetical protein
MVRAGRLHFRGNASCNLTASAYSPALNSSMACISISWLSIIITPLAGSYAVVNPCPHTVCFSRSIMYACIAGDSRTKKSE